jgi:hypothetical protein
MSMMDQFFNWRIRDLYTRHHSAFNRVESSELDFFQSLRKRISSEDIER